MSEEDMGNSIRMWQHQQLGEYVGFEGVVEYLKGRNDNPEQEYQVGVPVTASMLALYESWAKPLTEKQQKAYEWIKKYVDKRVKLEKALLKKLMSWGLSYDGAVEVIILHERLRSEGLSHEEAMKVVEEEIEIQALEKQGMTRSDAQGIVECRQRNEGSKQ